MAPLLNRSSIKAKFKTANAAQVEALYVYQRNLLTAYSEVSTEFTKIGRLDNIIRLKTEQMDANNRSAEIASDLFKTSEASYVEVLMAQRLALETKLLLMNAKRRKLYASIDLYKSLGGGWR
jgi:outer membrane protein TolC